MTLDGWTPEIGLAQIGLAQIGLASCIVAASWLGLRRRVGATLRGSRPALLLVDALPVVLAWLTLTALSARPLVASLVVAAMAFGLCRGDAAKQAASAEPLVFTDGVLGSIFFYPSLYAEFVTPSVLVASMAAVLAAILGLDMLEPPLWHATHAAQGVVGAAMALALWLAVKRRPLGRALRRGTLDLVTGDPAADAQRLGPLASVMVHADRAGVERASRRAHLAPGQSAALPDIGPPTGPVVLLQLESFFDARRLGALVDPKLLPEYDRCVAGSIQHGLLDTPAFGANTVRTEFAALTGLPEAALGLDRFNPYAAFARVPLDSVAWRFRAAGFRTICIHPFAGSFYGRSRVMPNLGFDQFLDIDAFTAREPGRTYVSDMAVMGEIERLLAQHGPKTFVFAITMGNHSPWHRMSDVPAMACPQSGAFDGFLAGLAETDAALGAMADIMRRRWRGGLLAAFGDHQPSFPGLFRHLNHVGRATDYVIWRPDHAFGERVDIAAHELPGLLLRRAADAVPLRPRLPQIVASLP